MTDKNFIYTLMASFVLVLGACTSEDVSDSFDRTADGTIDFNVGVEALPANRALTRAEESASTTKYYAMKAGTQVCLKVDGTWAGKDPEAISKKTTCTTIAAADATPTINALSFTENEMLYWDDYGTGDPNNKTNTDNGLKVLGVAVDGVAEAPEVKDTEWESLPWSVITSGENVLNGDIIVSNNLSEDPYKFVKPTKDHVRNMIFVHPLSKITINLKAGEGFTNGTIGNTTHKFEKDPVVTLTNATTLDGIKNPANDYCLTKGTINITGATATSDGTKAAVVAGTTSTTDDNYTVIKQAIVYPETQIGVDDDAVIAVVQADDNVYYIKAKQIHDKIKEVGGHTDFKTKAGYNYIINVTVNKTGIRLFATITDWNVVNSDEVYPVINVDAFVGDKHGNVTPEDFTSFAFWRSEEKGKAYQHEATLTGTPDGTKDWTFSNTLYWTHHNQHYHFRGIYPTSTEVKEDATDQHQYVEVQNGAYDASKFPSNFVLGMPEIAENTPCGSPDHTNVYMDKEGICARKAAINLNFRYMMSQVEVTLKSSAEGSDNYVDLTNAEVELVNVGTKGQILLSDRSAVVTTYADTQALHCIDSKNYHGIIVPQLLENSAKGKVKFKITVYSDSTKTKKDVYYAEVASIKEKGSTASAALTDAWKAGTHYVYDLKITKTEISATASLTDWTTVEGSQEVWF